LQTSSHKYKKQKTNQSQSVSSNVQHHVKLVNCYVTHQVNARERITCLLALTTMQQLDRQKQDFYTFEHTSSITLNVVE